MTTTDGWGNVLHVLTLDNPHKEITIRASGIVDIADEGEETRDEEAELLSPLVFLRSTPLTRADTAIREFAQRLYRPDAAEESLNQLMADLLLRMPYSPGATQVQDSAADAFARAKGVCQDHTHVFLACCRALEIPARYVSGYVYSDNAQHVAMHAWAEVWLDGHWLSFDITNNTRRLNQHLRLATGLDYLDACPVRGTRLGGGGENMLTNAEVREHSQQAQQQYTGITAMTYCVAMCLADGLVFASDSRTTRASTILPLLKSCTFPSGGGTGAGAAIRWQPGHHPERDKPAQRAHPYPSRSRI